MIVVHSGDLGDIVYAMAAVAELAKLRKEKAFLILTPTKGTRKPMTLNRAWNIGSLLGRLPYIDRWEWTEEYNGEADVDFREWRRQYKSPENLLRSQAAFAGVVCSGDRWIGPIEATTGMDIPWLVCRSHRYRNPKFDWKKVGQRIGGNSLCVGTETEFEELDHSYGFTRKLGTKNVAQLAWAVSVAAKIVTNQTLVYALAIAMGRNKDVILERRDDCPDVDFPGVSYDYKDVG